MITKETATIIDTVNAWAESAHLQHDATGQTMPSHVFARRHRDAYTLKMDALDALDTLDTWQQIERIDDTHAILQAPDGTRVLYDHSGYAERLSIID